MQESQDYMTYVVQDLFAATGHDQRSVIANFDHEQMILLVIK
jgi:hypothetical protein